MSPAPEIPPGDGNEPEPPVQPEVPAEPQVPARRSRRRRWIGAVLLVLLAVPLFPVFESYLLCPFMPIYRWWTPKRTALMEYRERQAARKGKPYKIRYRPVPLSAVSPAMRRAVVAAEDARFYQHEGFDVEAIRHAYEYNERKGRVILGGSTISQQLAKNLWLSPRRSWHRKLAEAVLTWRLEHTLSKERILELYLNVIEWGPGIFGVAEAARHHFGTSPGALSVEQAALLAAGIPSPLRFNPARPSRSVLRRKERILDDLLGRRRETVPTAESTEPLPPPPPPELAPGPAPAPTEPSVEELEKEEEVEEATAAPEAEAPEPEPTPPPAPESAPPDVGP